MKCAQRQREEQSIGVFVSSHRLPCPYRRAHTFVVTIPLAVALILRFVLRAMNIKFRVQHLVRLQY